MCFSGKCPWDQSLVLKEKEKALVLTSIKYLLLKLGKLMEHRLGFRNMS